MSAKQSSYIGLPTLERPVSQSCTASQFLESHYSRLCDEIGQQPRMHRKQWEYVYILRTMEQLGLMSAGTRGLGFGCGKEPLTDSHWGSRSAKELFYGGICSEEDFERLVDFRPVDMNAIPDDLGRHDFVWSCCALEHLGSLRAASDFILESTKCLKSGGYALHTTEFNTSSDVDTLESPGLSLFRRKDFLDLQDALVGIGCSISPLNLHMGNLPEDKYVDLPPYEQRLHIKLLVDSFTITSFGLVLRKH